MANVCDYVKWRGDLSLKQSEFNEIDNLILSRFSYFPFDKIINENEVTTIKELSERFKKQDVSKLPILWKDDVDLFPLMGESIRFGEMLATKYMNIIDVEKEKQFSAITVLMPDDTIFISYRGTDNTIVGWKEDLNMSFKSHIASQISAKKYLEIIAKEYPDKKIRIGGHSKGGNIAVYAATFAPKEIKDRIINVYNNDGPGFCDDVIETVEYKEMIKKVHTYIPQSSVIGRLMNHKEKYTVVESVQKGIMQHDLYSWQVIGKGFVTLEEVTNGSEFVDKTIKGWLEDIEPAKREQVIDVVFDILNATDAQTMKELKSNWFSSAKTILTSYKNIDNETKDMIWQTLNALFKIAKNNIFEEFPKLPEKEQKRMLIYKKESQCDSFFCFKLSNVPYLQLHDLLHYKTS